MYNEITRDPHSDLIENAKTVLIDDDNNYHCYSEKLDKSEIQEQAEFIAQDYDNLPEVSFIETIPTDGKHWRIVNTVEL